MVKSMTPKQLSKALNAPKKRRPVKLVRYTWDTPDGRSFKRVPQALINGLILPHTYLKSVRAVMASFAKEDPDPPKYLKTMRTYKITITVEEL